MTHGTKVPWSRCQARILDEEDKTSPMSGLMSLLWFFPIDFWSSFFKLIGKPVRYIQVWGNELYLPMGEEECEKEWGKGDINIGRKETAPGGFKRNHRLMIINSNIVLSTYHVKYLCEHFIILTNRCYVGERKKKGSEKSNAQESYSDLFDSKAKIIWYFLIPVCITHCSVRMSFKPSPKKA